MGYCVSSELAGRCAVRTRGRMGISARHDASPTCLLMLAAGGFILCLVGLSMMLWSAKRDPWAGLVVADQWRSYTTDEFRGLRWRWSYERDGAIQAPFPFCPRCDLQLSPDSKSQFSSTVSFHCDDCGRNFGPEEHSWPELRSLIGRLIDRKIRAGKYPKV
jgi:hypothetical protein